MPRYLAFLDLLFAPFAALACGAPPDLLTAPPQQILRGLEKNNAPYLAAMDDYSIAMEACYDGPQGPLELAPHIKAATLLHLNIVDMRRRAGNVRDNEFDYEALYHHRYGTILKPCGWLLMPKLGACWPLRCAYFRRRQKASAGCGGRAMRQLTFEFKHPILVQRACGLATAQIEAGRLAAAVALTRLRQSLAIGGDADFKIGQCFLCPHHGTGYRPAPD